MVKWSACSPSTFTKQVCIPMRTKVFNANYLKKRTVVGVNVLAIYSYNPSSNPAKPTHFVLNFVFEKEQNKQKEAHVPG